MEIPIAVFLRGDHDVNEAKILNVLSKEGFSGAELRSMETHEIRACYGLETGFIGPMNFRPSDYPKENTARWKQPQVYFDLALKGRTNMVVGGNRVGIHYSNVTPDKDFKIQDHWWKDVRSVRASDPCPTQGCAGRLVVGKAVEIGHIFKLGYKYTQSMGATVLDPNGKEITPIMGSYGIGVERILTAAIEQSHDQNGFALPASIAPFQVVVTITNTSDPALMAAGESLAAELDRAGFDVLLDDRDERAGVKFKDAELIGIPFRITVGKKISEQQIELFTRSTSTTTTVALADAVSTLRSLVFPNTPVSQAG
jgi:prolyl-tRNA synthetase